MPGSITPTRMERDHGHVHSHAHSRHGLDPKRRQTLQSLLDALVELQGDDEAFGTCLGCRGDAIFFILFCILYSCFFSVRLCKVISFYRYCVIFWLFLLFGVLILFCRGLVRWLWRLDFGRIGYTEWIEEPDGAWGTWVRVGLQLPAFYLPFPCYIPPLSAITHWSLTLCTTLTPVLWSFPVHDPNGVW